MQIAKNKTTAIAIAIFLTLSMGASMILLPTANAHTPAWQIPTFAYVVALPGTVGVGQSATVYAFLGNAPPPGAAIQNTYRRHNYQIIVTAPDGKNTTQFYETVQDTTGAQGYVFTPTQVGTYKITFNYLGQGPLLSGIDQAPSTSANSYINDTYLPSSNTCTLIVQQDPVPERPIDLNVLPTDYWTRPIYGLNPNWYTISSNWLGTGSPVSSLAGSGYITGFTSGSSMNRHPGDAIGPETSHIMWTYPVESGGVVGGNRSYVLGNTFFEGSAYNQRFTNPIVINGLLYYRPPISYTGSNSGPTICQDLRTGKILWSNADIPSLSFGYIYDVHSPNQHGTYPPILFTSNFARAFDAYTGQPLFNVTGVPTGTAVQGPQGEQLRYTLFNNGTSSNPDYYLCEWNSTNLWAGSAFVTGTGLSPTPDTTTTTTWAWVNKTIYENNSRTVISENVTTSTVAVQANRGYRYDWNVSILWRNEMNRTSPPTTPTVLYALYNNVMICRNGSLPTIEGTQTPYTYFAVSLKPQNRGNILWMKTYNPPAGNITVSGGPIDPTVGVFTEGYKETMQWVGYSMTTGERLWGPTPSQDALDYFGNPIYPYVTGQVAFGKLYSSGLAGVLYCYDLTNGKTLWTYGNGGAGNTTQSYFEVPGNYPIFINAVGSNGLLYLVTTEHTIQTPIYKGAETRCINATTGEEVWALSDYTGEFGAMSYAIADGYATFYNGYDDQIYSVGRGPSATTVTAPDTAAAFGAPVVIKGTVMDVSAGTKQNEQAARFPNGVPCASDANMKQWMGYVYQQQLLPTNFTGVPVTIDVLDSNGNYRNIGTATTDSTGAFHLTWTPDIQGDYTVIATFQGTNGYWPSYAETAMVVQEAPPAPATATPPPAAPLPPFDMYILAATVVIIIAIAIVGILLLRKRP